MRSSVSAFVALLIVHAPLVAQSDAALQQIAEGWASGECNLLTHVGMNPETGNWQTVEDSPWRTWTIRRAGPTSVEYTMSDGTIRRVEFADGVYRARAAEDADGVRRRTMYSACKFAEG